METSFWSWSGARVDCFCHVRAATLRNPLFSADSYSDDLKSLSPSFCQSFVPHADSLPGKQLPVIPPRRLKHSRSTIQAEQFKNRVAGHVTSPSVRSLVDRKFRAGRSMSEESFLLGDAAASTRINFHKFAASGQTPPIRRKEASEFNCPPLIDLNDNASSQ